MKQMQDMPIAFSQPKTAQPVANPPDTSIKIDSSDLFQGTRLITIVHRGESYSLRQTRLGKLILTK